MIDLVVWFFIGLFCGALPWSVWITRRFVGRDAREIGDGNPGSANAWKLGGWIVGVLALILDVLKGVVPVLLFLNLTGLGNSTNFLYQLAIGMVIVSPIIGHGWTPFLKFNGGKALATTMGIWTAVSLAMFFSDPSSCDSKKSFYYGHNFICWNGVILFLSSAFSNNSNNFFTSDDNHEFCNNCIQTS